MIQQTEEALLQGLRAWRLMTAIEEGVPSYRILSDETLQDLAQKRPVCVLWHWSRLSAWENEKLSNTEKFC